jgi:L-cysteine S-thiosulfotransferase
MERRARERDARSGAHRRLVTGRRLLSLALAAGLLTTTLAPLLASGQEPKRTIPSAALLSGRAFLSPATQAQQDDLTVNPGMLWVEEGDKLWHTPAGTKAISCATCHGEPARMTGVAARYPAYDPALRALLNLEGRIQRCRSQHQEASPLAYESQPLLALTALVAEQSRGLPISVIVDGPMRPLLSRGRTLYYQQQGQLNLSCAQCHEEAWGKRLRAEPISQGHPNGFPAYRLEWQTMGSLHRRLRACFQGVRAEPFASGSPELVALELFLAWRAQGLVIETPAVRR